MTVHIRPMTIDDYDRVLALWDGTPGIGLGTADSREAIAGYLERNPGLSLVAEAGRDGPAVVGAVLCGHDGRRGYLYHLAVDPAARRNGVGRALVAHCMDALAALGIERCHILVFRDNGPGTAFWLAGAWVEQSKIALFSRGTR